jgi:hypothetical protein
LALFGRRPPQRVDRPASRQPKTSTGTENRENQRDASFQGRHSVFLIFYNSETWQSGDVGIERKAQSVQNCQAHQTVFVQLRACSMSGDWRAHR